MQALPFVVAGAVAALVAPALLGAVAGVWLVPASGTTGLAEAAAVLVAVTAYGEYRSINTLVERISGRRHLDSIGRPNRA